MKAQDSQAQVIVTKYVGPSNNQGSRIIAKAAAGRVIHPYNLALSVSDNHAQACIALCAKFGWEADRVGGTTPDGSRAWVAQV